MQFHIVDCLDANDLDMRRLPPIGIGFLYAKSVRRKLAPFRRGMDITNESDHWRSFSTVKVSRLTVSSFSKSAGPLGGVTSKECRRISRAAFASLVCFSRT